MRTVVGYTEDGAKIWSENSPASTSYFEGKLVWHEMASIGGSTIQPQPSEADRHRADAAKNREKVRGLRGEKLK